jgi:uncharacterized protein YjbJ (UPF0337 family)
MNTNQDTLTGKWPELKSLVKQHWGKLTADDLTPLSGTTAELVGVLRRRYGYGQAQARIEIDQWLSDYDARPSKFERAVAA